MYQANEKKFKKKKKGKSKDNFGKKKISITYKVIVHALSIVIFKNAENNLLFMDKIFYHQQLFKSGDLSI